MKNQLQQLKDKARKEFRKKTTEWFYLLEDGVTWKLDYGKVESFLNSQIEEAFKAGKKKEVLV